MERTLATGPIVWLGIIVTTCLLLMVFQTVLWLVVPILLAIVAYYVLSPLVHMAMTHGLSRARAVFIVTVLLTIFLVAMGLILGPKISQATHNLPDKVKDYGQVGYKLVDDAGKTLSRYVPFFSHPAHKVTSLGTVGFVEGSATPTTTEDDFQTELASLQSKYSGDIALELAHWIPSLLLVPYLTYFFLLDGPRFKRFLVRAIPNAFFEKTLFLFYRVEDQVGRYFQGLLSLTALDALCLGVGLWFMGIHAPFFLAIIAAVMAWLPYLGSIGGGLLVMLVAAHDAPDHPWLPYEVAGLFVGVRLLDDFVFMPMTVGRSMHMHPLITVLMILLGGAVAGIAGLLLVMPVLGVVMVAGQIIGELLTDARVLARHRHAKELRRRRAQVDLFRE